MLLIRSLGNLLFLFQLMVWVSDIYQPQYSMVLKIKYYLFVCKNECVEEYSMTNSDLQNSELINWWVGARKLEMLFMIGNIT